MEKNTEIDINTKLKKQLKKILCRMQRLCIGREYCESDIQKKILAAVTKNFQNMSEDWREEKCSEMLQSLVEDKFIDNLRYSTAYCKDKATLSGWGPMKIKVYLSRKGISNEIINEALNEVDITSAENKMKKVLKLKFNSLYKSELKTQIKNNELKQVEQEYNELKQVEQEYNEELSWETKQKIQQKFFRYALSRGYSYDQASSLLKDFFENI